MTCCKTTKSINLNGKSTICKMPYVTEFSTAHKTFRDQITKQVLLDLQRYCMVQTELSGPVLLSDTTNSVAVTVNLMLDIPAETINSIEVSLNEVKFEIIGFSSAIVQITGNIVINVNYQGVDFNNYSQQQIMPFTFVETVPGDYPENAFVTGSVVMQNMLNINEEDPSIMGVTAVSINLFLGVNIMILAPS